MKISLDKIDLVDFQNIVFNVPLINDGRIIFTKNLIKKIFNTENYLDWIDVITKSIEVPGNTKLLFSEHFEDIQEISRNHNCDRQHQLQLNLEEYYSFAIVRNPLDRIDSEFAY